MAGNLGRKGDRRGKLRKMNSKRDNRRRERIVGGRIVG